MTELDIVAFLTRCLDEDQQLAEAAAAVDPAPWTANADDAFGGIRERHGTGLVIAADDVALWDCEGSNMLCMTAESAEFIAAHDPARVLADIAAKRELLLWHEEDRYRVGRCSNCHTNLGQSHLWPCHVVKLLAAPYAGQPGYNPAWAVG